MTQHLPKPRSFTLQWHVTDRCNWRCKHCYQEKYTAKDELSFSELMKVLDQYIFLLKTWKIPKNMARLHITGGEPFAREDFMQLLENVHKQSNLFNWVLLSNGSFITRDLAKKLKSLNIFFYQVSLEGLQEHNDKIRGKGSFNKVLDAIKILTAEGITTSVSLTLTKKNIKDIPELCETLYQSGATQLSTRRLIPTGTGSQLKNELIEPSELKEYYLKATEMNNKFRKQGKRFSIYIGCESSIFNEELDDRFARHYCAVYDGKLMVVMPNGDILPCRRLPIVVGNVMEKSLFETWHSSNKLWELRNLNNAHPSCKTCSNFNQCSGGALCVTYSYTKKLFVPDVQCWKYYKQLEDASFFNKFQGEVTNDVLVKI